MRSFRDLDRRLGLVPAAVGRQLSRIDIGRGRQETFAERHPAQLEALRQSALIESVTASNAIEHISAPRRRIQALVANATEPRNRPEAEIAGYRAVLDTIHASARHIPFTPNVVLQLHRDLYQFTGAPGGRWKRRDNSVTEALPDGTVLVRFEPVSAFETPAAMTELHDSLERARERAEHHAILLVAAYTLDFLVIHPFTDGNGRMARLLSLPLLYQAGYEVGRYVSLERSSTRRARRTTKRSPRRPPAGTKDTTILGRGRRICWGSSAVPMTSSKRTPSAECAAAGPSRTV